MTESMAPADRAKYAAARRAIDFVEDGMRLGLGTGSTAVHMVRALAELVREEGLRVTAAATSRQTAEFAQSLGLEVTEPGEEKWVDLCIDGADEVDADLNLIKGGGGALLMEKVIATSADQVIIIADASKKVARLGGYPLPVEVIPFGWQTTQALIGELLQNLDLDGHQSHRRMQGEKPFLTDQGNFILDLELQRIGAPHQLSLVLNQIPGVVENGLFLDICDTLILGHEDGSVELQDINSGQIRHERLELAQADNLFSDIADG
ncbi:MAG: ribose-5-phosphate isomerase RpiA [Pseudomonadota bacterium]